MPSSTVEDYLKQIYLKEQALSTGGAGQRVPTGHLAAAMGVVPGTATAMIKTLADSGLVSYEPRSGVKLTRRGRQLALRVIRRHRLIELFLVRSLDLDWSEVHEEAEQLEHAISDKVLQRLDELLGHPVTDPHGDPIPSAAGRVEYRTLVSLDQCEVGQPLVIARVIDQDASFLQFLERSRLTPGATVIVTARDALADALTVQPAPGSGAAPVTLGSAAAAKVMVEATAPA